MASGPQGIQDVTLSPSVGQDNKGQDSDPDFQTERFSLNSVLLIMKSKGCKVRQANVQTRRAVHMGKQIQMGTGENQNPVNPNRKAEKSQNRGKHWRGLQRFYLLFLV